MPLCGGISDEAKPVDHDVQEVAGKVKQQVESQLNGPLTTFEVVSYKTQVVAGRNYFVKVDIGNDNFIHLRIYRNLQNEVSLHSLQADKSKEDPIEYF